MGLFEEALSTRVYSVKHARCLALVNFPPEARLGIKKDDIDDFALVSVFAMS